MSCEIRGNYTYHFVMDEKQQKYNSGLDMPPKLIYKDRATFNIYCDAMWHYWIPLDENDIELRHFDRASRCPDWVGQLKKNSADAIFPLNDYAKKQTFESFDISYNNHGDESRQCQEFINGDDKIILISGPSHIGKTHLANAILNRSRDTGYPGRFITVKELESIFMGVQTFQTHDESMKNVKELKSIPFLIVDELNEIKPVYVNEFQDLIDGRIQKNNKTVITTNLIPKSINEIYGEKIENRFGVKSKIISLSGKRYRK